MPHGEATLLDRIFIALAGLAGLLLVFVGLNHNAYITEFSGALLYVGVPVGFVCAVALAFLLRPVLRQIIFLVGLSVIVAVYIFETWLWYERSGSPPPDADQRSQREVVEHLRADGVAAFPSTAPAIVMKFASGGVLTTPSGPLLPLGGVANSRIVHCNESGVWRIYDSDTHGFPNPAGAWDWGAASIVAVGDSYTQGACVRGAIPESW